MDERLVVDDCFLQTSPTLVRRCEAIQRVSPDNDQNTVPKTNWGAGPAAYKQESGKVRLGSYEGSGSWRAKAHTNPHTEKKDHPHRATRVAPKECLV